MKNYFIFIFFILAFVYIFIRAARAETADDIIDRFIAARGGKDKLNSIDSIYMEGNLENMPVEAKAKITKIEGKLYRAKYEYQGTESYTVVTPERGWYYFPLDSEPTKEMRPDEFKSMQTELDITGPLTDYKAKGQQAIPQGKEMVNERECYRILVILPDGRHSIYFIETESYLLIKSIQIVEKFSPLSRQREIVVTNWYDDYKDFGGVLFPQRIITDKATMGRYSYVFHKIELNIAVDENVV